MCKKKTKKDPEMDNYKPNSLCLYDCKGDLVCAYPNSIKHLLLK